MLLLQHLLCAVHNKHQQWSVSHPHIKLGPEGKQKHTGHLAQALLHHIGWDVPISSHQPCPELLDFFFFEDVPAHQHKDAQDLAADLGVSSKLARTHTHMCVHRASVSLTCH